MTNSIFYNQLRRLDNTLFMTIDKYKQRFVVYRRDRQNFPREILTIEDNLGEFCYPNRKHIDKLYEMDMWQNPGMIRKMDEHNEQLDREGDEKIHFISDEVSKIATRTKYY